MQFLPFYTLLEAICIIGLRATQQSATKLPQHKLFIFRVTLKNHIKFVFYCICMHTFIYENIVIVICSEFVPIQCIQSILHAVNNFSSFINALDCKKRNLLKTFIWNQFKYLMLFLHISLSILISFLFSTSVAICQMWIDRKFKIWRWRPMWQMTEWYSTKVFSFYVVRRKK